jgi:hypothetical protein
MRPCPLACGCWVLRKVEGDEWSRGLLGRQSRGGGRWQSYWLRPVLDGPLLCAVSSRNDVLMCKESLQPD